MNNIRVLFLSALLFVLLAGAFGWLEVPSMVFSCIAAGVMCVFMLAAVAGAWPGESK